MSVCNWVQEAWDSVTVPVLSLCIISLHEIFALPGSGHMEGLNKHLVNWTEGHYPWCIGAFVSTKFLRLHATKTPLTLAKASLKEYRGPTR